VSMLSRVFLIDLIVGPSRVIFELIKGEMGYVKDLENITEVGVASFLRVIITYIVF